MECVQGNEYTSKKKSFYASERESIRVQNKRENFIASLEDIAPDKIVVIDEAGANLGMATAYSRAIGGERAYAPKPFNQGKKFSMIGAIMKAGILAMMYLEYAVNADAFVAFIEEILLPKIKRGYYVILDNVRFHVTIHQLLPQ